MEKKQVAVGTLATHELNKFMDNISMLKVSADDKLTIDISGHNAPENTWTVMLCATDENKTELMASLTTGHLSRWNEYFLS